MKALKKTLHVISSPKSGDKSELKDERGSISAKSPPVERKPVKVMQKYYININYSSNPMKNEDPKRINSFTSKNGMFKRSIDKSKVFELGAKPAAGGKLKILPRRTLASHKNLDFNDDSTSNARNRRREEVNTSKQALESSMKTQANKQSFFFVCTPGANANNTNGSKLRIVSRDKFAKKSSNSKFFKINVQDRKITSGTKKSVDKETIARNPKAAELYMKLERLVNAKSRSIDLNKKDDKKGTRAKNDIVSEDKDQTKYIVADKPFNFAQARKDVPNVESDGRTAARARKSNKYYQYLVDKLRGNVDVKQIAEIVRSKFKKWRRNDVAEIYDFKSSIEFYKIKQKIGKGCFGKVYLATQLLTNTSVALKAIPKVNIKNKDARKKIEKEVDILKRVNNSSYIIKLFEVFEDANYVYLVFEYLENGDLVKYFKNNPLFEEAEQKSFFKKIIEGVEYLHQNQILHRDLKLDNILLDRKMNPKICDFGISSIQEANKKIYDTGGTPAYLAPEVIKAEGEVGPKSDVWSLGILLYLLTFGIVPFKANDMQVLYNKIIVGKYKFPECDFCSPELIDLIKAMLVVDVRERISLDEVINHKWYENSQLSLMDMNDHLTNRKKEQLKKEGILMYLEDLGFPEEFVQQTVHKNLFNHVKACVDSLLEKFTAN